MDKLHIPYSLRNIPLQPRSILQSKFVDTAEDLFRRMRWKLFHHLNPCSSDPKETFGFKTPKTAPSSPLLQEFENDLLEIVAKVEYRPFSNPLLQQMKTDAKNIKLSKEVLVKADKTTNIYKIPPEKYDKLLQEAIQADYRKTQPKSMMKTNQEAAEIVGKLDLADRVDRMSKSQAFVSIKDHKPRFPDKIACRLINPSKTFVGSISKQILTKVNRRLLHASKLNQWRSSGDVLDWFTKAEDKQSKTFLKFDIVSFYPSISAKLLKEAMDWAAETVEITAEESKIILHSRQAFLFTKDGIWTKKDDPSFDVTMGSLDGAECCELVGLYILFRLKKAFPWLDCGLYRDDGLALVRMTGQHADRLRKRISAIFQEMELQVTLEANLRITDFLDITFNLDEENHRPYAKPGNIIKYVSASSNHPPHIKKAIPAMVAARLSKLSSTKEIFAQESPPYQDALREAGYPEEITYSKPTKRNSRPRKVIWYKPPWSDDVSTNVGALFLRLLAKHFPSTSSLHRLFNRNNMKISYSCLPSMDAMIAGHNAKVISSSIPSTAPACNCRGGAPSCPLDGQCLQQDVVYQVDVKTDQDTKVYIGSTQDFKVRYRAHISSSKKPAYRESTKLSTYLWSLKDEDTDYTLQWRIIARARSYCPETGRCGLCTSEKMHILFYRGGNMLNKRSEIMAKCRHRAKHKLQAV